MLKINLQLFAEGGEGAASAADQGAAQSTDTGVKGFDVDAAIKDYQESKKPGGPKFDSSKYQIGTTEQTAKAEQTLAADETKDTPERPSYKDLIKDPFYKKDASEHIEAIVKERLKNSKDAEKTLKDLQPMLDALADSRAIKRGDIKALKDAILSDGSIYEAEAFKQGVPVEHVMQMKQLQTEADQSKARLAEIEAEAAAARFVTNLVQQGEELKAKYPGFDLRELMKQDDKFRGFVMDDGMDVETAYKATHFDEILGFEKQKAIEEARLGISRSLQAGAARPVESAARPGSQASQMQIDPRNLTDAQYKDIVERTRRGEVITLR